MEKIQKKKKRKSKEREQEIDQFCPLFLSTIERTLHWSRIGMEVVSPGYILK
jgi:hypothetical protein